MAAVIVGARLLEREHRADKLFDFSLDNEDRTTLAGAFAGTKRIPGDCGDEYRRPPFLTASGDLSHHLDALPKVYEKQSMPGHADRWRVSSGSRWEPLAGHSRAVRSGRRILVSGTTATHGAGRLVGRGDAGAQATSILDKIAGGVGPGSAGEGRRKARGRPPTKQSAMSHIGAMSFAACRANLGGVITPPRSLS